VPSTLVHAGFALLVAAGLLADAYDRRALALVLLVLAVPEVDSLIGPVVPGAHRAVGHNVVIPVAVGLLVYYDVRVRDASLLRERVGDRGVRLAGVLLAVHLVAHVALDWAHLEGVNLLWPIHDGFYRLEGELFLSTADGFVQTFVEVSTDPETGRRAVDAGSTGTTETVHVDNPVEPDDPDDVDDGPVDRRFPVAERGWQLYLPAVGLFTVAARRLQSDSSLALDRE